MALFDTDLFRNFAIGFVGGLVILGVTSLAQSDRMKSPAHAAQVSQMPDIAPEFVIKPDGRGQ